MKKISVAFFAILLLPIFSCKKDPDTYRNSIESSIVQGNWSVVKYTDEGDDKTGDFSGYIFTFEEGGILKANYGNITYQGFWSISDSNSGTNSINDLTFNIQFSLSPVNSLNDGWGISESTEFKLNLEGFSSGSSGDDSLVFERQV
jgi:hypothetical protein